MNKILAELEAVDAECLKYSNENNISGVKECWAKTEKLQNDLVKLNKKAQVKIEKLKRELEDLETGLEDSNYYIERNITAYKE